jgi:hypothetical protein
MWYLAIDPEMGKIGMALIVVIELGAEGCRW